MKRAPRDGSKKAAIIALLLEGNSVRQTALKAGCAEGYVCNVKAILKGSGQLAGRNVG